MNNAITPIAQTGSGETGLDAIAKSMKLSRSEKLERIGRGMLQVRPLQQEQPED
jgi:hypothetical protein